MRTRCPAGLAVRFERQHQRTDDHDRREDRLPDRRRQSHASFTDARAAVPNTRPEETRNAIV